MQVGGDDKSAEHKEESCGLIYTASRVLTSISLREYSINVTGGKLK